MKKTLLILITFLCVLVFIALPVFSEDNPKEVSLSSDKAGIVKTEGEVTVVKTDGKSYKAAEGAVLTDGDQLFVGKGASVQVAFGDNLERTVRIEENSEIKLTPSESARLTILKGKLFAAVKNLAVDEKFDVRTPVAVCCVRGTFFEVLVVADQVDVSTYEGSVYLQSPEDYAKGLAAVSWVNRGSRTKAGIGWHALVVVPMSSADVNRGVGYSRTVWAVVADYTKRRGRKFYEGISYLDPSNLHPKSPWKNLGTMDKEEKRKKAAAEFNDYMKRKTEKKSKPRYGNWKD
ncbi:MAG: FecR family protein [Candidatus Omnitrophica bacterium]|nr:FecR family protein [Candidatus Omnitrophota bacterium]